MRWFKHMTDLSRDEDISRYLDVAGRDKATAYGFLMLIFEVIASRMGGKGDNNCSATYSIPQWGRITYSHPNRVRKYLSMCEVIGWVLVEFEGSSCKVSIPRMVEWRDEYTRKSGHTQDKVAQSRANQSKTDQKESKENRPLSNESARKDASRSPPHDFEVTPELRQWAKLRYPNIDIDIETEKFRLYEFSRPISNWDDAWKKWIISAFEFQQKHGGDSEVLSNTESMARDCDVVQRESESDDKFKRRVLDASLRKQYPNIGSSANGQMP